MKKIILAAIALTSAVSVFAQGTVVFNNRVANTVVTRVYAPLTSNQGFHQAGNASAGDFPTGATDWTGFSAIGTNGLNVRYGANMTMAAILGAAGYNQSLSALEANGAGSPLTTFQTGAGAGRVAPTTATLNNVPADAPQATLAWFVWDNSSGLYPSWSQGDAAWEA